MDRFLNPGTSSSRSGGVDTDRSRSVSGDSSRTRTPDLGDPDDTPTTDIEDTDREDESRLDEPWQTADDTAGSKDRVVGTQQLKAYLGPLGRWGYVSNNKI
jgi:hypothetical protein